MACSLDKLNCDTEIMMRHKAMNTLILLWHLHTNTYTHRQEHMQTFSVSKINLIVTIYIIIKLFAPL